MESIPFCNSEPFSLGVELELQIINPQTSDLIPRAKELLDFAQGSAFETHMKPEITQSMIEINGSIHRRVFEVEKEFELMKSYLLECGATLGVEFCGGGTHPYQKWDDGKIFPAKRFKDLFKRYGYLAKQFTVFGMHIHIGCSNGDEAIYLTHALSRYVPHFIALSAASPFYEGVHTDFECARLNMVNLFPLGGHIPYLKDWEDFSNFYDEMRSYELIESMKDFYWDIKPRPEFGTVEVRICDTPLSIEKVALLTSFIQTLSYYLLLTRSFIPTETLYKVYPINRFTACRDGYQGIYIDPNTGSKISLLKDIYDTLTKIRPYAKFLDNEHYIKKLVMLVERQNNDALFLLNKHRESKQLQDVVKSQCKQFAYTASASNQVITGAI